MRYSLLFLFDSLPISCCCSGVAGIVSSSVTLRNLSLTGNESTNSSIPLWVYQTLFIQRRFFSVDCHH